LTRCGGRGEKKVIKKKRLLGREGKKNSTLKKKRKGKRKKGFFPFCRTSSEETSHLCVPRGRKKGENTVPAYKTYSYKWRKMGGPPPFQEKKKKGGKEKGG